MLQCAKRKHHNETLTSVIPGATSSLKQTANKMKPSAIELDSGNVIQSIPSPEISGVQLIGRN
ncbi:MAG TPA: hypothetical protein DEA96_17285 [Leptospiraceae bacterium]|nr:hypothetical protein [Spirochaetaceae bacterium]HBS06726.1 hypothetical protein [Leptospiraceae bacterium]